MAKLNLSKSDVEYITKNLGSPIETLLSDLGMAKNLQKELQKYVDAMPKAELAPATYDAKSVVLAPISKEQEEKVFTSSRRNNPEIITYIPKKN